MAKTIFNRNSNSKESSLTVNEDGTLTYWRANDGWVAARKGEQTHEKKMTVEEAKQQWPQYASKIDEALSDVQA
jgi:hypothetical protein